LFLVFKFSLKSSLVIIRPGSKEGLSKEEILLHAEETGVSKDPMGGVGGFYDGWSGFKQLTSGDPPLVCQKKKLFALTVRPAGCAGVDIAKALHVLAHREKCCTCGSAVN